LFHPFNSIWSFAAADAAGGNWLQAAREACIEMSKGAQDSRVSLGVRLLAAMRYLKGQ
jgi:Protein of unknown function (DUF3631).